MLLLDFFTDHIMLCPSSPTFFVITCVCSCLLGPPASQGTPLLECRCCHCHTCTTHRPSFLPLHSVSPGVQVLLFPFLFLSPQSTYICLNTQSSVLPFFYLSLLLLLLLVVFWMLQCTLTLCFVVLNYFWSHNLLIILLSPSFISILQLQLENEISWGFVG